MPLLFLILAALLMQDIPEVFAQGVGKFAAPILRINPHARKVAMGEAFAALPDTADYNILRYNAGGLGFLRKIKFSVNYHNWINDTQQGDLEIAIPVSRFYGVVGFGITYFDEGSLTELNPEFQPTGRSFESNDWMFSFGYGSFLPAFGQRIGLGFTGKIISQSLAGENATGIALDLGGMLELGHFAVGATYQNLTLKEMKFIDKGDSFPEILRAGVAAKLPLGSSMQWRTAADVAKIRNEDELRFFLGSELKLANLFSIRGGYKFHNTEASRWSTGFGLTMPMEWLARSRTDIDYAFTPLSDFDDIIHRFSFNFTFGEEYPVSSPVDRQLIEDLRTELSRAEDARRRLEQQARQFEEEMQTRLERIQRIALTSAGKIEVIPDTSRGVIDVNLRIEFEFDKADIRAPELETMRKVAEILNEFPDAKVLVSGHADSLGTELYNIHLSQRRMQSVLRWLDRNANVNIGRFLWPVAYGESRPIADNGTPEGRARNRRVEFTIFYRGQEPPVPDGTAVQAVTALTDQSFAIVCNGAITRYELKEFARENKLIVDFPGTYDLSNVKLFELQRGIVQRARIGYHPQGNFTRVVFDLTRRPQSYSASNSENSVIVQIR